MRKRVRFPRLPFAGRYNRQSTTFFLLHLAHGISNHAPACPQARRVVRPKEQGILSLQAGRKMRVQAPHDPITKKINAGKDFKEEQ